MQSESLEVLEKADVPPRQGQAFVHAIEIEMIAALSTLATKQDLEVAKQALETKIGGLSGEVKALRADLETQIGSVRADLEIKIGSVSSDLKVLRADLETRIGSVSSDLKVLRADLETKIGSVRADLETKIGGVNGELRALRADLDAKTGSIRAELQTTREELRKEMQSMRGDLVDQIHASMNRSTWQLCGLAVTLIGMMLGVVYFLVSHNVH